MTARRRPLLLAGGLLALVAGIAHWWFWYAPRARAGLPRLAEARALLADPGWEAVVWVAYPHQNLGALGARVGDVRAWLGLLAESAGRPAPRLPRFGPWSAPPSEEWVVALEADGATRAVAAVYPLAAWVARAAGAVAGNPWLAGGDVDLGGGRRGRVDWQGRIWRFATDGARAIGAAEGGGGLPEAALAGLRVSHPPRPLPAGLWRIAQEADGGVIAELGQVPEPLREGPGGADPPAAWIAEAAPGPVGGPWALLLWESGGTVEGFPRAALIERGGGHPFELPGARIARLARLDPNRAEVAGVLRSAFDEGSLGAAGRVEPWLLAHLPGPAGAGPWRQFAAGADPARAEAALRLAAKHLAQVPILGERETARLRRAADLLAPWQGCGPVDLEIWRDPDAARLRLCAGAGPR